MRATRWIGLGLMVSLTLGCQSTRAPRLIGAPPAGVQRERAEAFDPYPQVDYGSANMNTDVRPRDYAVPRSETVRAQQSPFARFPRWGK